MTDKTRSNELIIKEDSSVAFTGKLEQRSRLSKDETMTL